MITLSLVEQSLSVSSPIIAAGTVDYLDVQILRNSKEWEDLDLHVFFRKDATVYELLTSGCYIGKDAHLNLTEGKWHVSVSGYAYEDDQLVEKITTNTIGLTVEPAPPDAGISFPEPTPSAIEQIEAIAQGVRDDADNGKFDGRGIASVELNDDYTLTITFTDNTSETYGPIRGAQGEKGDTGDTGATGAPGATGATGAQGPRGLTGAQGPQGPKGETGATGNGISSVVFNDDYTMSIWFTDGNVFTTPPIRGAQGPHGAQGVKGDTGATGMRGPQGETGETGATGPQGPEGKKGSLYFGKLDGTSTSTVMTAQIAGITELYDGLAVYLTNGVVTSASGWTLEINSLGALPVYQTQAAATRVTTVFNVNYTGLFVYNSSRVEGGCWDYFYGYNSDTNTIGYQIRTQAVSMQMDSVTYRYRLLFQKPDGKKFIPANNSTSTSATASKTVCQSKIDPFGIIVYYGTTASVSAGSKPNSSYLWQQYNGISLGYSFNRTGAALTMTASQPVYLKCTPQSDGTAIMDPDTPIVQALPSTEDGKIYIFLGIAESATAFMLMLNHPVYYYKDGQVRPWPGLQPSNKYVVTLTPTSLDYSGTMDKTVGEINAAYEAGMDLVFRVMTSSTTYMDVDCTARWNNGSTTYPSFNGYVVTDNDVLLYAFTGITNDGTKQTYATKVYSLTPAS